MAKDCYAKQLRAILTAHGFTFSSKKKHEKWVRGNQTAIFPSKNCKRHTANGCLKQLGINEKL